MSSSSLDTAPLRGSGRMRAAGVAVALALGAAAPGSRALAAQVYVQPQLSAGADWSSNRELLPPPEPRVSGMAYDADAAALFSIATPDSQTNVKPRVRYDYYPGHTELNTLETYLDFNSELTRPRDRYSIFGDYARINDLHAELPAPQYNTVNPGTTAPTTTGQVNPFAVSNVLVLVPDYVHSVTPLTQIELTGTYERMTFSPSDEFTHVNFNYGLGKAAYSWTATPRASVSFGVFGSTYRAANIDSTANSGGGEVDLAYSWSPVLRSTLSLLYQHTKTDEHTPLVYRNDANAVGFSFQTTYQGQTDQLRATLQRTLLPSSSGGLYETDQAQMQDEHHLSERLAADIAVVYLRTRDLGNALLLDNRDYAAADLSLEWRYTRTLYVSGGYSFAWQKYLGIAGSAMNHTVFVELGYRGLPRPQ